MFFLHGLPTPPGVSVPKDSKKRRFNLMITPDDDQRLTEIRAAMGNLGMMPSLAVTARAGLLMLSKASPEDLKQALLQIQQEDKRKAGRPEKP